MTPPLDRICRQCGEPLPLWATVLGICGGCLTDAPSRGVPGPSYASLKRRADQPHPFDIVVDDGEPA